MVDPQPKPEETITTPETPLAKLQTLLQLMQSVADDVKLVHSTLYTLGTSVAEIYQRVNALEKQMADNQIPLMRPQLPSFNEETKRENTKAQTESLRVTAEEAVKQTPMIEAVAKASRLTPMAVAAGMIASAFVSGVIQYFMHR